MSSFTYEEVTPRVLWERMIAALKRAEDLNEGASEEFVSGMRSFYELFPPDDDFEEGEDAQPYLEATEFLERVLSQPLTLAHPFRIYALQLLQEIAFDPTSLAETQVAHRIDENNVRLANIIDDSDADEDEGPPLANPW
jgi:hypothetical protein